MNLSSTSIIFLFLISSCTNKSDIKNEIEKFHICISLCEEIETTNTYNYFKESQACIDVYEEKKKVCLTLAANLRQECLLSIIAPRDQCLEICMQRTTSVKAEIREKIKKCKDVCVYHLKHK